MDASSCGRWAVSVPCRASPTTLSVSNFAFLLQFFLVALLIRCGKIGYAPEPIQYGIDRYGNETRRLYRTMDEALKKNPHGVLVGDRVTIADISAWGWVASHSMFFFLLLNFFLFRFWNMMLTSTRMGWRRD